MRRFDFSLSVKSFFPLFIGLWIPFVALYAVQLTWGTRPNPGHPYGSLVVSLVCSAGIFLLYIFFAIPFLRRLVPAVSLQGKPLSFRGSVWPFVGLNLLGLFLSVITIGIYAPWYIERVTRYLAGETAYDGRPWEFSGRGGRLFVILLLTFVLPVLVLSAAFGVLYTLARTGAGGGTQATSPSLLGTELIVFVLVFLIMPAYAYELYRWVFVNLRIGGVPVRWATRFWPSVGTILLQLFLTAITATVYFPAAYVRVYSYFARRTSLVPPEQGREGYMMGFDGTPGGGFGLIWGQTLLSLITLGIYAPWAVARIGRWFASHTTLSP